MAETISVYDVIYLSLVKKEADNGVGLAMSENYIYTQEAIGDYMDKLNESGQLAFLLHNERELAKIVHAAMNYFRKQGILDTKAGNHLAVIGTYQHLGHEQIPVHIPHVQDQFSTLLSLFEQVNVNVAANTDDRPFFFNHKHKISRLIILSIAVRYTPILVLNLKFPNVLWLR